MIRGASARGWLPVFAGLLLASVVWAAGNTPELLVDTRFRAVTLQPGEAKMFRIPMVEKLTGSSGNCLEESLDTDEEHVLVITAKCGGVRTSMVWLQGGERIHMLACAEDSHSAPYAKTLRAKVNAELKGLKSVTACARGTRVELWGWVDTVAEEQRMAELTKKHDLDNKVERVDE